MGRLTAFKFSTFAALLGVCVATAIAAQPKPHPSQGVVNLQVGASFQECPDCPTMVVIPAGSLRMGFDGGEKDRYEGPVHDVTLRHTFAAGRTEVTNAQYAAFLTATGYIGKMGCNNWVPDEHTIRNIDSLSWRDPGYGRPPKPEEPVACVSWNDAKEYVNWLRNTTKQPYRLLTEAEWEYIAHAASNSVYPWGDDPEMACQYANIYDASAADPRTPYPAAQCKDGFSSVSPVASFPPNKFGLYDVIGNVWEWVEDCYVMPYAAKPVDGSAQLAKGCDRHSVRGGSWRSEVKRQRPTFRGRDDPDLHSSIFGIRVARDLP